MTRSIPRLLALWVTLALAACAARAPSAETRAELGRAASLIHDGCYTCVRDAVAIYDRLTAADDASIPTLRAALDAAILLVLREKELGLPWEASLERARALAGRVPDAPPAPPPLTLLAAAELVVGQTAGLDPEARARLAGRARPPVNQDDPTRRALDAYVGQHMLAAYIALAIDCDQPGRQDAAQPEATLAAFPGKPAISFRAGLCERSADATGTALAAIRTADPRWTDTLFFEARRELIGSPSRGVDLYEAEALLADAQDAFPSSFAIALVRANTNLSLSEFGRALAGFDHVLNASPTHRDAMLGRLTALSHALRHDEAIATASRMIELGTWHIGDAYYWRAWNRYAQQTLEPAWTDVEQAVKLLSNTSVYMLAGLIAYGREDRTTAIDRFDRSFDIDGSNCDAVWMASVARVEQRAWPEATDGFSRGMRCYLAAASAARADLATLEAGPHPEGQKVRPRARLQRTIEASDERAAQSAFNAAQGHLRQGNKEPALIHVDVAAAFDPLREKALALRAAIEKLRD